MAAIDTPVRAAGWQIYGLLPGLTFSIPLVVAGLLFALITD